MVMILRKKSDIFSKNFTILIIFFILGVNVVSGIVPDKIKGIEVQEMVQQPTYYSKIVFLESGNSGKHESFNRKEYSDFFYNFTVTSNSTGVVNFAFTGGYDYNPALTDSSLGPGESYGGNFTFIGTYGGSTATRYMFVEYYLESGVNATFIFERIVWDNLVYKIGLGGYITFGVLGGLFIIFIVLYARHSKGKTAPKL